MKTNRFELRLSDQDSKKLQLASLAEDVSQGEILRKALRMYYSTVTSDRIVVKDGIIFIESPV